jgi:hypothetical protein
MKIIVIPFLAVVAFVTLSACSTAEERSEDTPNRVGTINEETTEHRYVNPTTTVPELPSTTPY